MGGCKLLGMGRHCSTLASGSDRSREGERFARAGLWNERVLRGRWTRHKSEGGQFGVEAKAGVRGRKGAVEVESLSRDVAIGKF